MALLDLFGSEYRIISIVGMAKNAGKTVTMNHLIDEMAEKSLCVGVTSIGRDGERQDIVTKTDKPLIHLRKGSLVATAEVLFNLSEVKMEILEVTAFHTAMGRVIIGRTLSDGFVQVGGPTTNHAIREVSEKLCAYGANYVLVDGALDRTSSASPAISDACLLSTGAVVSRDMNKAVDQTIYRASLFQLNAVESSDLKEAWEIAETNRKPVIVSKDGQKKVLFDVSTAIGAGKAIAEALEDDTTSIVIPGALVTQTVMDVIQTARDFWNITWIVGDATKIFIEHKDWLYFMRIGVNVKVRYEIKLKAITVNPYAPSGYFYDSDLFVKALQSRSSDLPIVDVMR